MTNPAGQRALSEIEPRVTVARHYDRLLVTIHRRQIRVFSLSLDEAEDLAAELRAQLAEVSRAG